MSCRPGSTPWHGLGQYNRAYLAAGNGRDLSAIGDGRVDADAPRPVPQHARGAMRVVASVRVPCFSEARDLTVHQAAIAPRRGGVTRRRG